MGAAPTKETKSFRGWQAPVVGCCAADRDERQPPKLFELLTESRRSRHPSTLVCSQRLVVAEATYRKHHLGLVFEAFDAGTKGHLDLEDLRELASSLEIDHDHADLKDDFSLRFLSTCMRILNNGDGYTVNIISFTSNMYT